MKLKQLLYCCAFLSIAAPITSYADLDWKGFMSVGGGIADPDDGDELGGYPDTLNFSNETVLGLQVTGEINDKWSATGQIVSRGSDDFEPQLPWAYLKYESDSDWSVKFGRFALPYYLFSDFLEVGYAYHWASPPKDVYIGQVDSTNGIDFVFNTSLGSMDVLLEAYIGAVKAEVDMGLEVQVDDQIGGAATLSNDWLTLRAGLHSTKTSVIGFENIPLPAPLNSIGGLIDTLNSLPPGVFGTGPSEVADLLITTDTGFLYSDIAAKVELDSFLFIAELTALDPDEGISGERKRWYTTAGYKMDPWMFHITHSESDDTASTIANKIPVVPGATDGLVALVNGLTDSYASKQETNTIGLRYDFDSSTAFKLEISDIDDAKGADGKIFRFVVDAVF